MTGVTALAGASIGDSPYVQRSLLMHQRWRKGFELGEIAQADGEHFKTK